MRSILDAIRSILDTAGRVRTSPQSAALIRWRKALVRYPLPLASNDSRSVLALKGSLRRVRVLKLRPGINDLEVVEGDGNATKQLNLTIPKHEEKQPARCSRACQLPA